LGAGQRLPETGTHATGDRDIGPVTDTRVDALADRGTVVSTNADTGRHADGDTAGILRGGRCR
jgi:hypothetical protein